MIEEVANGAASSWLMSTYRYRVTSVYPVAKESSAVQRFFEVTSFYSTVSSA